MCLWTFVYVICNLWAWQASGVMRNRRVKCEMSNLRLWICVFANCYKSDVACCCCKLMWFVMLFEWEWCRGCELDWLGNCITRDGKQGCQNGNCDVCNACLLWQCAQLIWKCTGFMWLSVSGWQSWNLCWVLINVTSLYECVLVVWECVFQVWTFIIHVFEFMIPMCACACVLWKCVEHVLAGCESGCDNLWMCWKSVGMCVESVCVCLRCLMVVWMFVNCMGMCVCECDTHAD